MPYFWLSFCDAERPKNEQFIGCAIIQASSDEAAVRKAWELGINPGGEMLMIEIAESKQAIAAPHANRLMSREQAEAALGSVVRVGDSLDAGTVCQECNGQSAHAPHSRLLTQPETSANK